MWRLRLIGFCFLVLVISITAMAADTEEATQKKGPVAVAETKSYTFPSMIEGTEARHDFVIRNTGDAPLVIHEVKTG